MAKKTDSFDFESFSEILLKEAGGMECLAQMLVAQMKSGNSLTANRAMSTVASMLKRAGLKRTEVQDMTDRQLDEAMQVEIARMFVSLPEDEFNAAIDRIKGTRRRRQTVEEGVREEGEAPKG